MLKKTDYIQNKILAELLESGAQKGDPIPSRHQLCRKYHCSRTTVERAIRNLVESGYLCARQGARTYVHEMRPDKRIHTLYLVADTQPSQELSLSLRDLLFQGGLSEIQVIGIGAGQLSGFFSRICLPGNAVVWLMTSMSNIHIMDFFAANKVPQLLLNRKYKTYSHVITDSKASIREGMEWLIRKGGPEITLIAQAAGTMHPYQYDRILAFFESAVELKAELKPDSLFIREFRDVPGEISEIASTLFHRTRRPESIFILGSNLVIPFITASRSFGLNPGTDFKLLCFDRLESLSGYPGICMLAQRFDLIYQEVQRWIQACLTPEGESFHSEIKTERMEF